MFQIAFYHFDQRGGRFLQADRDAHIDSVALPSQHLAQRASFTFTQQIPERHFQTGFGHQVAAHERHALLQILRRLQVFAQDGGQDEIAQDVPGSLDCLIRIARVAVGDALAVAGQVAGLGFEQDTIAGFAATKGGFEGRAQRHAHVA